MIWKSKKNKPISPLTTDAEYLAVTETTRDICWIRNIFTDPVELRGEYVHVNALASGTSVSNRAQRIDIRQRSITEKIFS